MKIGTLRNGWIKLHRRLQDKGYYSKSEYIHLWIECLLSATHTSLEQLWNGKTITLNPGQFITGRKKMSMKTGISESRVQRILKFLEIEQQIEQQTSNTSRLITILNWHEYQLLEQPDEQRVNNGRTTSEQRVNTIQEGREGEERKEGEESTASALKAELTEQPTIPEMVAFVKACRPEFARLPDAGFENVLKDIPKKAARQAVVEFCANMANAIQAPSVPANLLGGYIKKRMPEKPKGYASLQ